MDHTYGDDIKTMKKLLILLSLLLATNAWGIEIRTICFTADYSVIFEIDTIEKTILRTLDDEPDRTYYIKDLNQFFIYAEHLSKDKTAITGLGLWKNELGYINKAYWGMHTKKELLEPDFLGLRQRITHTMDRKLLVKCISD